MNQAQVPGRWSVSPYNFLPETAVLPGGRADLYDTTLRDGEQTPGVVFRPDDRVRVARQLDALGVQRIEAGFPVVSSDDREGVTAVAGAGLNAEVWGFSRCLVSDVDVNRSCGVRHLLMEVAISEIKMSAYGLTREQVTSRAVQAVAHAKALGMYVAFMPVDLTRADPDFARGLLGKVVREAGADEAVVVDTVGAATPEAIGHLVRLVREELGVPVAVHCHNEFGLAVANSIAGVKAGAGWIHVTLNGLGEKSGNADLAEVALALRVLYGVDCGTRLDQLTAASRMLEELSGFPLAPNKPVVGRAVFQRESGGVVQQLLTDASSVEAFSPDLVGNTRGIVLGKKSGRYSVVAKLQELGLTLDEPQIQAVLEQVKRLSVTERRPLADTDFQAIVRTVSGGSAAG